MSTPYAGYQQSATYNASQDRAIGAVPLQRKLVASAMVAVDGVIAGAAGVNLSATVTAGWGVSIEYGSAMVAGYQVVVPAAQVVTHAAAGASARRDLIVLRVRDVEAGDASNSVTVEIVQGTTTADPTIPARSLVLAHVTLRASSGSLLQSDITDRRVYTGAGNLPVTYRGSPIVGTAPATGKGLVLFAGRENVITNVTGDFTVAVPVGTFSQAVCAMGCDTIDVNNSIGIILPFQTYTTLTAISFRAYYNHAAGGGTVPVTSISVSYWALGL